MTPPQLSAEELELLHELINIAFGRAVADLQHLIDIFVVLRPPEADLFDAHRVRALLEEHIARFGDTAFIEQPFYGDFRGKGLLVLPGGAGRDLISILDPEYDGTAPSKVLEEETLLEVGNILIGACIGQLSELLDTHSTYAPPRVIHLTPEEGIREEDLFTNGSFSLVLRTSFEFEHRNVEGFLLLISESTTFTWLREALALALERLFG
ncbi:MAG: chemotaxis protein CheC [Deltaproteobacteria bacterium]|nr:chemotaxis protein CheC [Deltaproteobacteria bacterium]